MPATPSTATPAASFKRNLIETSSRGHSGLRRRSLAGSPNILSAVPDEKRMRLRGVQHVTAICKDLNRTIGLYRDVLGLGIVHDGPSDDDPSARHVWFGTADGSLVSFMQYPQLPEGVVGVGSTHHFALRVDTLEALDRKSVV